METSQPGMISEQEVGETAQNIYRDLSIGHLWYLWDRRILKDNTHTQFIFMNYDLFIHLSVYFCFLSSIKGVKQAFLSYNNVLS